MQTAFVPAALQKPTLTKPFNGTAVSQPRAARSGNNSGPTACFSLDNYAKYNDDLKKAPAPSASTPSTVWKSYVDSVEAAQFNVLERAGLAKAKAKAAVAVAAQHLSTDFNPQAVSDSALAATGFGRSLLAARRAKFGKGGDPDTDVNNAVGRAADAYMASCVTRQYKQTAAPTGVYSVQCTEGTVRLQAEEARNAALSAQFRYGQRSSVQKFGDFCETRRQAIIASHGCSYEEKLVDRFPKAARALVTSGSEAKGNCVRYAGGTSPEETYMAACVDKQMKFRAVPMGVYDVICNDGNTKFVAEYKRVAAMSARFRAQQLPAIVKEQAKFNNAKYARDFFAHECSYEEGLFSKYKAVSASMRPSTARY